MKSRMTIAAGLLMGVAAGPAGAAELQFQLASQGMPDPDFALVSEVSTMALTGVKVTGALRPALNLSWVGGYEYGSRLRSTDPYGTYDEYGNYVESGGTVESRLSLHGLEAGVRWGLPLRGGIVPYAALTGKAYVGHLRMEDDMTGWAQPDPEDPTGESSLYEVTAFHALGVSAGLQGSIGLAVTFPPRKAKPVALAMALPSERAGAEGAASAGSSPASAGSSPVSGVSSPTNAEPGPASAASGPANTVSGPADAGAGSSSAPASGAGGAGSSAPAAAGAALEDGPAVSAPGGAAAQPAEAAVPAEAEPAVPRTRVMPIGRNDARSWGWGLNLELGYGLLSDLHFANAGAMDMGGLRVQGGVLVMF